MDLLRFSDFHNYTFFQRFFILKRDRFWYSVVRRESLLKYHDGRTIFNDSWNQNFLLQQQTLFFFKEGFNISLTSRNFFNYNSSLKFLSIIENSVLKKHVFLIFILKILFFIMYIYLIIFFVFTQLFFIDYFFLIFLSFFFYLRLYL